MIERIYYSPVGPFLLRIYDALAKGARLKKYDISCGIVMEIDLSRTAERAIRFNAFEPVVTEKFMNSIKEGDVVIDVGAWIGYYTLLAAHKIGTYGKVIAVEAHNKNVERLNKNIEINKFSNVIVMNLAVGQEVSTGIILEDGISSVTHQVMDEGNKRHIKENLVTVDSHKKLKIETLDNIISSLKISEVNLLIMDIEGYEYFALIGLSASLSGRIIKNLIIEIHPKLLEQYEVCGSDVINVLEMSGYDVFVLDERLKRKSIPYHIYAKMIA